VLLALVFSKVNLSIIKLKVKNIICVCTLTFLLYFHICACYEFTTGYIQNIEMLKFSHLTLKFKYHKQNQNINTNNSLSCMFHNRSVHSNTKVLILLT